MENVITYKTDEVIFKENSSTGCMYLVKSGAVVLYLNYGKDNEHLLGAVSHGKIFGENGLNINGVQIYTAVALGDTTVIKITRSNFREYVVNNPDTVLGLIRSLTNVNALLKENIDMLIEEFVIPEKQAAYLDLINTNIAKETAGTGYHFIGQE